MANKITPMSVVVIIMETTRSLAGPYVGDAVGDSVGNTVGAIVGAIYASNT